MGRQYDNATELDNNWQRVYDPLLGSCGKSRGSRLETTQTRLEAETTQVAKKNSRELVRAKPTASGRATLTGSAVPASR